MIALKFLALLLACVAFTALWWMFLDWFTGDYRRGWWWQRW